MLNYQKTLLGILATVVILIVGIQIYLHFFLDEQLKERFVANFHAATDHSYNLAVDDLDLQIFGQQLLISGVNLNSKKNGKAPDLRLTLDELNISGINIFNFLFWDDLRLKKIDFVDPKVSLTANRKRSSSKKIRWHKFSQHLSKTVLTILDSIFISDITISGLSVNYNRADAPVDPYLSISNSDIKLSNITIDSTSLKDHRIVPAQDIEVTSQNLRWQPPNGLYNISVAQFEFSSSDSTIQVNNFSVIPKLEKGAFSKKVGHEIDRVNLGVQQIKGEQIDLDRANSAEGIAAGLISIENADLDIYRDKRRSDPAKSNKPLPREMIQNIPFPIALDSIRITESTIRYSERVQNADKAGYVEFANLSASFLNLTNIESRWKNNTPTLRAETKVMDKARLSIHFTFFMAGKENRQHITGHLQPMNMQPLNHALEPLAFIRIDKGQILGLDFDMNLSEKQAGGTLTLQYEDLKISLLDKGGSEENLGNKAKSFLANTFKIKSENKGTQPRVAKVDFKRIKEKSVFNYWWKSLLSGLKESIGL